MKKYKVELTKEQLSLLKGIFEAGGDMLITGAQIPALNGIHTQLLVVQPIQGKVWLPFITLKYGGTYLTRDSREVIVVKHPIADTELLNYPYRDSDNLRICWDKAGRYYGEDDDSPFDLILELQPSEEQTGE